MSCASSALIHPCVAQEVILLVLLYSMDLCRYSIIPEFYWVCLSFRHPPFPSTTLLCEVFSVSLLNLGLRLRQKSACNPLFLHCKVPWHLAPDQHVTCALALSQKLFLSRPLPAISGWGKPEAERKQKAMLYSPYQKLQSALMVWEDLSCCWHRVCCVLLFVIFVSSPLSLSHSQDLERETHTVKWRLKREVPSYTQCTVK